MSMPQAADRVRHYRTTPDLIADTLREEIAAGALQAGRKLGQEELAGRFGVSRIPIREALLRLEAEGLVVVYPNRGAVVAALSIDEVREIYDLRLLLEPHLLTRSMERMTPAALRQIERACAIAADAASGPDWFAQDRAFHLALYAPAGRPRQLSMVEGLRGTAERYWSACRALPGHTEDWLADHRAILAACRAGDAAAGRAALTDHLRRAAEVVIGRMGAAG